MLSTTMARSSVGSSIASNPVLLGLLPRLPSFLWDNGKLIDLNSSTIGGNPLSADWFNAFGEIVGVAAFPNAPLDAYLWRNGWPRILAT